MDARSPHRPLVRLAALVGIAAVSIDCTSPLTAVAGEVIAGARGWRTTVTGPLAGREPGWPVTVVSLERPAVPIPHLAPSSLGSGHRLQGLASYYWQSQSTASGERFQRTDLTAAHPTLPFGTRVNVINTISGRSVIVRINDRGPFMPGRIIDLSEAAGAALGIISVGVAPVRLEIVPAPGPIR